MNVLQEILDWDKSEDQFRAILTEAIEQYPTLQRSEHDCLRPDLGPAPLLTCIEDKLRGKPLYYFPIDAYFTASDIQQWLDGETPSVGQMEVVLEYAYQSVESHLRRST